MYLFFSYFINFVFMGLRYSELFGHGFIHSLLIVEVLKLPNLFLDVRDSVVLVSLLTFDGSKFFMKDPEGTTDSEFIAVGSFFLLLVSPRNLHALFVVDALVHCSLDHGVNYLHTDADSVEEPLMEIMIRLDMLGQTGWSLGLLATQVAKRFVRDRVGRKEVILRYTSIHFLGMLVEAVLFHEP